MLKGATKQRKSNCGSLVIMFLIRMLSSTSLIDIKIDDILRLADWQYICLPSIRTSTQI